MAVLERFLGAPLSTKQGRPMTPKHLAGHIRVWIANSEQNVLAVEPGPRPEEIEIGLWFETPELYAPYSSVQHALVYWWNWRGTGQRHFGLAHLLPARVCHAANGNQQGTVHATYRASMAFGPTVWRLPHTLVGSLDEIAALERAYLQGWAPHYPAWCDVNGWPERAAALRRLPPEETQTAAHVQLPRPTAGQQWPPEPDVTTPTNAPPPLPDTDLE
jgi:hypothetical protein